MDELREKSVIASTIQNSMTSRFNTRRELSRENSNFKIADNYDQENNFDIKSNFVSPKENAKKTEEKK